MVRRSAGLIGNARTSSATSSAFGGGGSAASTHSITASGRPKVEKRAIFIDLCPVCSGDPGILIAAAPGFNARQRVSLTLQFVSARDVTGLEMGRHSASDRVRVDAPQSAGGAR